MADHRAYMKLYVGDYLADTGDLDATGTGAYLLLIMHYWQNGGLPTDHETLRRIARLTPRQASKWIPRLSRFFSPDWRHKRIDRELERADELHEKRSRAAAIGNARLAHLRSHMRTPGDTYPYKNITTTETVPRSKEDASRAKEDGTRKIEPTDALAETIRRKGWTQ